MSRSELRTEVEKDRTKKRTELDIHFNKKAMQSQTLPRDATTKVNKHPAATYLGLPRVPG